ncbi:MAG: hypothetical protein SFU25_02720 [Candidatus Caenarcaniphilales bacterium]|nr:hypothetical protein [Candidatus Caenarcaniphilales bacterium]
MKNKKFFTSLTLCVLVACNLAAYSVEGQLQSQPVGTQVLSGEVIHISAGASAPGKIDRSFTSSTSRVGDRGILTLNQNLQGIPAGSKVEFVVSSVTEPKRRFDKPGTMQLKAVNIIYPDGSTTPLTGEAFISRNGEGTVLVGEANKKRVAKAAGKTAAGAATGALGGLIGSSIGGRASGKATAIGAGIGAGVGLIGAGLSKGDDVVINSGDTLLLKFTKATQITPSK